MNRITGESKIMLKHGGQVWSFSRNSGIKVNSIIDLSANINDFIYHKTVGIPIESIVNYPDTNLEMYLGPLARYNGVGLDSILPGPGLTYFIYRFAEMLRNTKVLVIEHAFGEYSRAFRINGSIVETIMPEPEDRVMDRIECSGYSAVVLTRPDNPLGNAVSASYVERMAEVCENSGTLLFIDEAFVDFMGINEVQRSSSLPEKHGNVIVGRSLTKILGAPSMRIGYIVASPEYVIEMKSRLEPWSLGQFALEFMKGLDHMEISSSVDMVDRGRKHLIESMETRGFAAVGIPRANFVTFRIPDGIRPGVLFSRLEEAGILVRTLQDHPELGENHIRVAVKRREKTEALLDVLDSIQPEKQ